MPGMSRSLLNSKESPRFFALAVALGLSWAHKGTRGSGALGCQTLGDPPPLPHTTHFRLHFRSHLPAPSPSQHQSPGHPGPKTLLIYHQCTQPMTQLSVTAPSHYVTHFLCVAASASDPRSCRRRSCAALRVG